MRKRTTTAILLTPVFLLVLIYGLLISPLAGPMIKLIANQFVAGLSVEKMEGGLADSLSFQQVDYRNEQWHVHLEKADLDATWRCLFEPRVCINNISINGLTVTQLGSAPAQPQKSNAPFSLPLPIDITQGNMENFTLTLPDQTISIGTLALSQVQGDREISIDEIALDTVVVTLLTQEEETAAPKTSTLPTRYSLSYSAPQLPTLSSPIPVSINGFEMTQATLIQKGDTDEIQTLQVVSFDALSFEQSQLVLRSLYLSHPRGKVSGNIHTTLSANFPLEIDLQGEGYLGDNTQEQMFELSASGALDDLTVEASTEGEFNGVLSLSTNLLSDQLPVSFSANWQTQPIPTLKGGTLHDGEVVLEGTMGNYLLKGNGGATLPDVGNVPVALDVVLKRKNIFVNQAEVSALGGSLRNTGTLHLGDAIFWEGETQLTEISATDFSPYAPESLSGQFESIMQWSPAGLEMSIRNLNVEGRLQQKPLSMAGAFVYSGSNDLAVANLTMKQGSNEVAVTGQVLNNRYLNADIHVNVAAISSLYPDVSGTIKGNVVARGPWNNPNATGSLAFNDINVASQLSAPLSQQGPLNGELEISGRYTDHTLNVNLILPDHEADIRLKGQWQNHVWRGQLESSALKLANTEWQLTSPFALSVGTSPLKADVSSHCWASRGNGELCIDAVHYQDNTAKWHVFAKALPVGLWANELAPDIVSAPSKATLSFNSKGQYAPQDPIDATFDVSLSSADWQLGVSRPLTIRVNNITTTGTFKQGQLQSQSLITSADLGEAELNFNANVLGEEKDIDGQLTLKNIDVAPLKPLSPAIRTLTGVLNGEVEIGGNLASPTLNGEMQINNGAIDIQDTPVSLENWQQRIVLNNQQADFNGSFILGGGEGALNGNLSWQDTPSVNFNLKGSKFEVRQPNMRLRVSPDITVNANAERVDITGSVNIPWARIEVESLPESAVSPSKDVHLRGEPPKEEPLDIVHASVMVNIDKAKTKEVKFEAFGLSASLHGGVKVNTQPALVGFGDLQILDGLYSAYGQQLVIQTGEIQFNGPLDQPLLLVEAIRDPDKTDDDVIAGIRIDGAADAPSINLFSEPAMDQQNVLSYLLTGQGADASSGSQDPNYGAILLGLGLSNTKTLTGQVGEALGIDDFSLSTNESKLSVTGQINQRLSVEYNVDVGLSNNDTSSTLRRRQDPPDLALRYQLLPRLFLEAVQTTIEDQSEFALDLYYEFFLGESQVLPDSDNEAEQDDSKNE